MNNNNGWLHFNIGCIGFRRDTGRDKKKYIRNIHISILEIKFGNFDGSLFRFSYTNVDPKLQFIQWDSLYLYQLVDWYQRKKENDEYSNKYFETEIRNIKENGDNV